MVKLMIWVNGDPSVGINGDQTELELNVDGLDDQDRRGYIEHAKQVLGRAFSELWDDRAHVMTEAEINADTGAVPA